MLQNHLISNIKKMRCLRIGYYLRSNYSTKSGKLPVMARISYQGEVLSLGSTGVSVSPEKWNGGFIGRSSEAIKGQTILNALTKSITSMWEEWSKKQETIDLKKFREYYKSSFSPSSTTSKEKKLSEVITEWLEDEKQRYECGIIKTNTYRSSVAKARTLLKYIENNDIKIKQLDKEYANKIQIEFFRQNKKTRTINAIMGQLKSICIYATSKGWLNTNPLYRFKLLKVTENIRCLTIQELRAIVSLNVDGSRRTVKDIFEFMALTSLAYADVFRLTMSHIHEENNGTIIRIRRQKTTEECVVPLLGRAKEILELYVSRDKKKRREAIFPWFDVKIFNKHLKNLAQMASVDKNVTSHMARHTFGSIAVSNGVHLKAVQKCMGHKSVRTTEKYSVMQTDALQQEINKLEVLTFNKRTDYECSNE